MFVHPVELLVNLVDLIEDLRRVRHVGVEDLQALTQPNLEVLPVVVVPAPVVRLALVDETQLRRDAVEAQACQHYQLQDHLFSDHHFALVDRIEFLQIHEVHLHEPQDLHLEHWVSVFDRRVQLVMQLRLEGHHLTEFVYRLASALLVSNYQVFLITFLILVLRGREHASDEPTDFLEDRLHDLRVGELRLVQLRLLQTGGTHFRVRPVLLVDEVREAHLLAKLDRALEDDSQHVEGDLGQLQRLFVPKRIWKLMHTAGSRRRGAYTER